MIVISTQKSYPPFDLHSTKMGAKTWTTRIGNKYILCENIKKEATENIKAGKTLQPTDQNTLLYTNHIKTHKSKGKTK